MMKTNLSLVVLFFLFSLNSFAQDGLKNRDIESPFSLGIQTGFTFHTHYTVQKGVNQNSFGVNYFEFLALYKIGRFEFGISVGQDEFTIEPISGGTTKTYSLRTYNWGALNLNYYFSPNTYTGIKGGYDPRRNSKYFAGNFGTDILSNHDWRLNAVAQVMTNLGGESYSVDSYQLNLLFNVRFKPDISGIF